VVGETFEVLSTLLSSLFPYGHNSLLLVHTESIQKNLKKIREKVGNRFIWAVVKADCYGLGLEKMGVFLKKMGVDGLAVAKVEEALLLRSQGVPGPILLLSPLPRKPPDDPDLHLTIGSVEDLKKVSRWEVPNPLHLKVDTGMGRLGVLWNDLSWISFLPPLKEKLYGIWTHYHSADLDPDSVLLQRRRFFTLLSDLEKKGYHFSQIHLSNSSGLSFLTEEENAVRVGLFLYGVEPWEGKRDLCAEPVVEWVTEISSLRYLPAGSSLSYRGEYVLPHPSWIGVLPVGYADGLTAIPRKPVPVWIKGRREWVRGRITMDLTLVEIGESGGEEGDLVYLLGPIGVENGITVKELSSALGEIPYEFLTRIGRRVKRWYTPLS
jgi:alanine racemase